MTPLRTTPRRTDLAPVPATPAADALAGYRDGLRLMALRALGDMELAEEVAQETTARALSAIHSGDGRIDHLGAFMHGIARHVIADILRGRERFDSNDTIATTPCSSPDPLAAAITADERERIQQALARLNEHDRRLLHLTFFDGLSPSQVAARLNQPALRVRKRKSRALERLRRIFLGSNGHDAAPSTTHNATNGRDDEDRERSRT